MILRDIVWLPQVLDKLNWKHGLSRQEVEEVLKSGPLFRKVQRGHSPGEHLYSALGRLVRDGLWWSSLSTSVTGRP